MPQGPPRNLRELQERASDDGPMLASSGISRWAQRRAQSIRERLGAAPQSKAAEFSGHFNDIMLFLRAAEKAAPSE